MALTWNAERPAHWDADKARIVGDAPTGAFDTRYRNLKVGDVVPGDWWRVEENGAVLGYGWLDVSFGDAEILLATAPSAQKKGVGAFVLDHLDAEARARGLNYLTNIVRPSHPQAKQVTAFLEKRGFKASEDGRLVRPVKHH